MLQARQLDRVAQQHHAAKLGLAIHILEKANRSLHLGDQVIEHRSHRLEHSARVFRLSRVALQMLRLGEGQFQFLRQLLGEVVAADRNTSLPNSKPVSDDQVA